MPALRTAGAGQASTPLLIILPLIVLCLALIVACIACAVRIPPHVALAWAGRTFPFAACATLACLLLAIAPAAKGSGLLWLVPLWLSPVRGGLGWAVPSPHNPGAQIARITLLALPLMMALLTLAWSRLPPGILRAASAAGAPPSTLFWLALRLWLPGAALACVPVGIVCLALMGW